MKLCYSLAAAGVILLSSHAAQAGRQDVRNVPVFPGGPTHEAAALTVFEAIFPEEASYNGFGVRRDKVTVEQVERDGNNWWIAGRARYVGLVFGKKIGADRAKVRYDNGKIAVELGGMNTEIDSGLVLKRIEKWIAELGGSGNPRQPAPTPKSPRWLDAASDRTSVSTVKETTHGTVWHLEDADNGMVRLRSGNRHYRDNGSAMWLDAASDGESVSIVDGTTHGTLWYLEDAGNGLIRLRSANHHFRRKGSERWLDAASDGESVSLVNEKTHGTRWRLEDADGGGKYLRSFNNNFAPR